MTAEDIAALRAKLRYSQAQLAEQLGVSTHTVSNWEQGVRRPSGAAVRMLEMIAEGEEE